MFLPQRLSIEEKHGLLKERLAHYLLLQVHTFLNTSGKSGVPPAMKRLVEKAAEIKVERARSPTSASYSEALGWDLVTHMGEAFDSRYRVIEEQSGLRVTLDECGCISSIIKLRGGFDLGEHECKAIFCGSCMGGYRAAADKLGLRFEGRLSDAGCAMEFWG